MPHELDAPRRSPTAHADRRASGRRRWRSALAPAMARLRGRAPTLSATVSDSHSSIRLERAARARGGRASPGGERRDVVAVEQRPGRCVGPDEPAAGVEGRGLAGAVRADQPGDACRSAAVEADVVDRDEPAEADDEVSAPRARRPAGTVGAVGSSGDGDGRRGAPAPVASGPSAVEPTRRMASRHAAEPALDAGTTHDGEEAEDTVSTVRRCSRRRCSRDHLR